MEVQEKTFQGRNEVIAAREPPEFQLEKGEPIHT
jgi:hypothetical protein